MHGVMFSSMETTSVKKNLFNPPTLRKSMYVVVTENFKYVDKGKITWNPLIQM